MEYEQIRKLVSDNLNNVVERCWFGKTYEQVLELEKKGVIYTGKIRDSFPLQDGTRAIVVADGISAFDKVATRLIPFKGQALNRISNYWFDKTEDISPNHLIESPHPNVSIVHQCKPLPIEMIVRGYLTGSGWRDYREGKFKEKYGIELPNGMQKNQKLEEPILTPTTKAPRGQHDEAIWPEKAAELVGDKSLYNEICEIAMKMFEYGTEKMKSWDCIFVDTKYEFGMHPDLVLIDEINTSDSSRFWRNSTYNELWQTEKGPEKFDKEILRQWIMNQGYDPKSGAEVSLPNLTDGIVIETAIGYVINFQNITGELPQPISEDSMAEIEAILRERGMMAHG